MTAVLDECQKALCTLRSQRNTAAAVHLLAPTLDDQLSESPHLLSIFQIAANHGRDFRTLLSISHTCSYWRKICLTNGDLYRCIDITTTPLSIAELFASRSSHPFSLTFLQNPETQLNPESFFAGNASAAREIHLSLCTIPSWLGAIPANELNKFVAALPHSYNYTSRVIETLFGNITPKLQELSLTGFRLAWNAKAYHGLKKLSISLQYPSPDDLASQGSILMILQNSPQLEELSVRHPPFSQTTTPVQSPIILPSLSNVNLELTVVDVFYLLTAIHGPPHQKLKITIPPGSQFENLSVIPADPRCCQCVGALSRLEIDRRSGKEALRGWTTLNSVDPSVEISFGSLPELLSTLSTIRTLDLASNIEVIHVIDGAVALTSDDLIQLLKLSSRVTTLQLESCSTSLLSSALAIQILYSRVPFCAHFNTLIFRHLDVRQNDVLSFCQSLPGRLRKVDFIDCRFESLDVETQLLNDLRESGIGEVLSLGLGIPTSFRPLYIGGAPKKKKNYRGRR